MTDDRAERLKVERRVIIATALICILGVCMGLGILVGILAVVIGDTWSRWICALIVMYLCDRIWTGMKSDLNQLNRED